ncbi:hypothetical protein HID58_088789, partial [Brassica napus]
CSCEPECMVLHAGSMFSLMEEKQTYYVLFISNRTATRVHDCSCCTNNLLVPNRMSSLAAYSCHGRASDQ